MSLLGFLFVTALVTGTCVAVALAFARAVLYQSVLGELDVTRASRSFARGQDRWRTQPRSTPLDVSEVPGATSACRPSATSTGSSAGPGHASSRGRAVLA